ncbi:DEAD/DEAH box helicase [Sphingobacterium multivorum]|uniref:DEAD/DEAH box helicase n=1 Tax=Sphingobacterium multivorum TaxID=28454 RepID=UPI003DA5698A
MQNYENSLNGLTRVDFNAIRNISVREIQRLDQEEKDRLWSELERGVLILDSDEHLCQYMFSFGPMHQAKLLDAFAYLPKEAFSCDIRIIDWGCGQGMGTINFLDHIRKNGTQNNVKQITLIEPSVSALNRAKLHVDLYFDETDSVQIETIQSYFEQVTTEQIASHNDLRTIHIFSNILDVAQIDLKHLASLVANNDIDSYLVCVGPLNPTNHRIDAFLNYFDVDRGELLHEYKAYNFRDKKWTNKTKIFKLAKGDQLIPIEYYPTVQFLVAYELDYIRDLRKEASIEYPVSFTHFETAALFDLGASVYDDINPVLAVLNNIISRGIPTKASLFIEETISQLLKVSEPRVKYGQIDYISERFDKSIFNLLDSKGIDLNQLTEEQAIQLQVLLTPLAVARFQKVLLEALITGHLSLEKSEWNILVEEKDVPFAQLALTDFTQLYTHLIKIIDFKSQLRLPKINLTVINETVFFDSPLQQEAVKFKQVNTAISREVYDMVVTHSFFDQDKTKIEKFSRYKAHNSCYFNIISATEKTVARLIYTSDLITYKNLVVKDQAGNYTEIEETCDDLRYFVRLLFRKEDFRPGQIPILDRALQHKPVIGLLPTGGGKSLTYQIAALLQPGVTIIIDPLKSLMKDQYDGLLANGVDSASYINSSLTAKERAEQERRLESSELQFIFLSPERLSIASFRERLKHMHDYNVYFAYGVIDEVHCVSEWGHDFRFSYLHLGRNLYHYVRSKNKEISLYGLTATASFDVLADVERELSANGTFELDSDTIVRYENTNRLELQYKIEKVPIRFEENQSFDKSNEVGEGFPKPIKFSTTQAFGAKASYLQNLYADVPTYFQQLVTPATIDSIKTNFKDRQNSDVGLSEDLHIPFPVDYYKKQESYNESGIVFCPHVNTTGISVNFNRESLDAVGVSDVVSFSGKDNDETAIASLEQFRDNKSPLMVATKAFGMGIDKPNVRFTVNMNYSSSLESFVQEAGRAGRDRKMALATILMSDYSLTRIKRSCKNQAFPLSLIKEEWYHTEDLNTILDHYDIQIAEDDLLHANPINDIVKLRCDKDKVMFDNNICSAACSAFQKCKLKDVPLELRGWQTERELREELQQYSYKSKQKDFEYLNPDYGVVMYFFGESFKGDIIEKTYMHELLNVTPVRCGDDTPKNYNGFLTPLLEIEKGVELVIYIPYSEAQAVDLSKAIYRMCCIELIEDFTQDYASKEFRIIVRGKSLGDYFNSLERFLLRYYSPDRALLEIGKAKEVSVKNEDENPLAKEVYQCLGYLTSFVYDKISEKRKRAIDDTRNFCVEGLSYGNDWLKANESLKDYLYYYFNSKYAKPDYVSENGEPFSLVVDTDEGKHSNESTVHKYLRVIEDDLVGVGTPLDNVRHLYGAVRLISRSLTDSNPALYLLEAFCLAYLGTKNNENLKNQFKLRYTDGMIEFARRFESQKSFWQFAAKYNAVLEKHISPSMFGPLKKDIETVVHINQFNEIAKKYLQYE